MPENKNIPALRFPGFDEPWVEMKWSDIYKFYSTNSLSREKLNYDEGGIYNIHYGDIHTKYRTIFDITNERVPFINRNVDITKTPTENYCQEQDLIIADASEDYDAIGKTIEIDNLAGNKVLAGLHTFLARPNKAFVAKHFGGHYLKAPGFRSQIKKIAQGTKVLSLSPTRLSTTSLIIPQLVEQQKIASFLSAIDERLQQLHRQQSLLEQFKKGCMQQIFSGRLRFKDENGETYPDWQKKKLSQVGYFIGGGTPSTKTSDFWNGTIPWISSSDLKENDIRFIRVGKNVSLKAIENSATKVVPKNSVLIVSRVGVGKLAVNDFELCTSQDFTSLVPQNDNSLFIAYNLANRMYKLVSYNQGTSIKGFVKSDVENLEIPMPILGEQEKIANFLNSIDNEITLINQKINLMEQFKNGLLQQMFM